MDDQRTSFAYVTEDTILHAIARWSGGWSVQRFLAALSDWRKRGGVTPSRVTLHPDFAIALDAKLYHQWIYIVQDVVLLRDGVKLFDMDVEIGDEEAEPWEFSA